mmetsp:Transcript_38811/g.123309  ORF Transcript_38811/g.123309 Transcript_38811/m.123309 type:complete len:260 (-) Transcript_38811:3537-4316(-)
MPNMPACRLMRLARAFFASHAMKRPTIACRASIAMPPPAAPSISSSSHMPSPFILLRDMLRPFFFSLVPGEARAPEASGEMIPCFALALPHRAAPELVRLSAGELGPASPSTPAPALALPHREAPGDRGGMVLLGPAPPSSAATPSAASPLALPRREAPCEADVAELGSGGPGGAASISEGGSGALLGLGAPFAFDFHKRAAPNAGEAAGRSAFPSLAACIAALPHLPPPAPFLGLGAALAPHFPSGIIRSASFAACAR